MSADKRVPARSDEEIRAIAERTKQELKVSRRRPVNILRCLEAKTIQTLYGRKKLEFVVVPDEQLPEADAKTDFTEGVVTVTARSSVCDRARMGVGRDRMTLAHELGHAVMHHSASMFRLSSAAGASELATVSAHTSAEHQAKVFAAAFLIHDEDASQMRDAEEISVEFGISLQAAQLCYERLLRKKERQRSAERVRKIADEAIAILRGSAKQRTYLEDACPICHKATLTPDGNRVRCDTCGFIGDRS